MDRESEHERGFMLAEYTRIGDELIANETAGDARVNLYVTLWAAAVVGVAAFLQQSPEEDSFRLLLLVGLVGLCLIGAITLARLMRRATHTDRLTDALARLRRLLKVSKQTEDALPWNRDASAQQVHVKEQRSLYFQNRKWRAGLLEMVVPLNAAAAGMVGLVLPWQPFLMAAFLFVAALLGEYCALQRGFRTDSVEREKMTADFRSSAAREAG